MKKKILVLCLTMLPIWAKVLVITHTFNRPDFIELQHKTFKKFLKDDYEFVVFNDADRNPSMHNQITSMCNKLNLRCITIPQALHDKPYLYSPHGSNTNSRCAIVVQYSLDILGFDHNDVVAIIDSDMFLIKPFSIKEFLGKYDIAGVDQVRGPVHYLWNGIVFFNMNTIPEKKSMNWNYGSVENQATDVGGYTYYYFKKHPEVRIKNIEFLYMFHEPAISHLKQRDLDAHEIQFLREDPYGAQFYLDLENNPAFLHYRAGSNWTGMPQDYHAKKTIILNNFLKNCLTN